MKTLMWKGASLLVALGLAPWAMAQSAIPMLVNYSGVLTGANGAPWSGVAGVTFLLYKDQQGGAPLWMETQNVTPDRRGHYTVTLGATSSEGIPAHVFANGEARWLAVEGEGLAEPARVPLVAVPYALKAKDAETIGGLPPSAFVLAAPAPASADAASVTKPRAVPAISPDTACTGITSDGTATANQVAKFTAPCIMEPSAIFESGGKVGIGTTTPAATLDVKGTAILRSTLTMNAKGAATAAAGATSNPLDLLAASFDSSTSTSIGQHFRWQAEAAGNDTGNPSGTLNLLYAPGSGTPAETGLLVNSKGLFTFGTGQTFPGVGTITGVTAGAGLTGGGTTGTVNVGLTGACASGQVLQWNGSAWACSTLGVGTITGVTAGVGLSGGGTSGSVTLANTGVLAVAAGTGITSSGGNAPTVSLNTSYTDGRYLQLAGGTMSGPLNVPANGLTAAGNQLVLAGGQVGIGTATPGAQLEVAGNLKISGGGSGLTFPDGTTQTTAGNPAGVVGVNPLQVALLKWFPAYSQFDAFPVGLTPTGVVFDGTNIWVSNRGDGTVTELAVSNGKVVQTVTTGCSGSDVPWGLAFDGAGIWVALYGSNQIARLYYTNNPPFQCFGNLGGLGPVGLAFDGTNIWVTNHLGSTVTRLNLNLFNPEPFNVGTGPYGVAFDGANIWVANEGSNTVTKLRTSDGACVGTCTFGVGASPIGVAFDGSNIWVANYGSNTVTKLLASNGTVVGTYNVGFKPYGLAFDGTNIWVTNSGTNTVTKLDASGGQVLGTFTVGNNPLGIAFDGVNIWVANASDNTVSKL